MNKVDAVISLSAIDIKIAALADEAAALRKIIEAPEQGMGLWKPEDGKECWRTTVFDCASTVKFTHCAADDLHRAVVDRGCVFKTREAAEKAAPLMARANKIIAAALQADPDAGGFVEGSRKWTASMYGVGTSWTSGSYSGSAFAVALLSAFVHTREQADAMAAILNAEGVK